MKNLLQNEIVKGIKKLGLSQQYNVLNFLQEQTNNSIKFTNRLIGFTSPNRHQAMNEIQLALVLGPDKMDF
ncbi:MAG: hypothetical protein H7329_20535 [Opitutaceae bacterium]|nr:hypothetical protein [Cytophagales bacterium]